MRLPRRMVRLQQEHRSRKTQLGKGTSGTQRRLGQCDAGSWVASILAPIIGAAVACLLALACFGPAISNAKSLGVAPDPSPQPARSNPTAGTPTPDPSPHAATSALLSTSRRVSSSRTPSTNGPAPTGTAGDTTGNATGNAATSASTTSPSSKRSPALDHSLRALSRRKRNRTTQPARAPADSSARSDPGPLAVMLRRLGELFRPADQAGIAAAAPQRNGILLLLSALALGVLVVAGSSLGGCWIGCAPS